MRLSTRDLVAQLRQRLTRDAASAARTGAEARDVAQHGAAAAEKRQDARVMIEYSNLSYAHGRRAEQTLAAVRALDSLCERGLPRYGDCTPIGLGAIVEAMGEDDAGTFCKTFVVLPVGAGEVLTGPGGDGMVTVLTPQSPVGRAILGKRAGDVAEVVVRGEPQDWEIVEVCS